MYILCNAALTTDQSYTQSERKRLPFKSTIYTGNDEPFLYLRVGQKNFDMFGQRVIKQLIIKKKNRFFTEWNNG